MNPHANGQMNNQMNGQPPRPLGSGLPQEQPYWLSISITFLMQVIVAVAEGRNPPQELATINIPRLTVLGITGLRLDSRADVPFIAEFTIFMADVGGVMKKSELGCITTLSHCPKLPTIPRGCIRLTSDDDRLLGQSLYDL